MKDVPLSAVPNQSLNVRLGQSFYTMTIKETRGVMGITVARDNGILLSNMRMTAGTPIIPYQYLQDGNFFILTENSDLPYYTQFGVTQNLVFMDASEWEAFGGRS